MAIVSVKGKQRIITNNGKVQLNSSDNRILFRDGTNYRFVIGDRPSGDSKVVMSKPEENVLYT